MLEYYIEQFKKRYPNTTKETFHLIESNGLHVDMLFLFFAKNFPTAYIYHIKKPNQNFYFIAL